MPKDIFVQVARLIPAMVFALAFAGPAEAYVGPGSGLGAIGVVLGVIGTVFLSLVSLVWYPLKRGYRRVRGLVARLRGSSE